MTSDWLRCMGPRSAPGTRLICAPHGGGAASMFAKWSQDLPADIETWAIQLPCREDRVDDTPAESIDAIVGAVGPDVVDLGRDSDVVLVGNCLGALVMYELARWLRDHGRDEPRLLVVAAFPPPRLMQPPPDPPVHQLPDEDVIRIVGESAGIDKELMSDPEMRELLVPAFRADARVQETYRHQPGERLTCPVLAIGGHDDSGVPAQALRAWSSETSGAFTSRIFGGDHLFMLTQHAAIISVLRELLGAE